MKFSSRVERVSWDPTWPHHVFDAGPTLVQKALDEWLALAYFQEMAKWKNPVWAVLEIFRNLQGRDVVATIGLRPYSFS